MSDHDRYILNVNPGELDVIHRNPRNECNTESSKMASGEVIDEETALALLAQGDVARRCEHCYLEEE